ncbi:hypothetical protein NIES593_03980 [Hydrococcus rivularis NIES-593]|uniref:Uncharacterized protein n=1 Tax=Hydrococcus rivularis NIES-593 TaxID=1921803 RepID=A0A1U7HPK0_9CYAN|nr:alr0857 family protein [Hydrococcus rivularis]OKH25512.1 hypothetical protein NIES593_03980 [Hydrococcus rivularis NIES-593]
MLKLTYTENGFNLEHLDRSLEDWVTARVILALRSGTGFYAEPSTATFLLPADLPYLSDLEKLVDKENGDSIELSFCDGEYVEVILQGTWLASVPDSEEGIFVTVMSQRTEFFLYQLWQEVQIGASVVND